MSKIIIHGRNNSSNVQPVMWAAAELGLEVERTDVGGPFGKTDTPEYLAINPMGLVPSMEDSELKLFESAAIVRYLGAQYGNEDFWPTNPAKRAGLDQWAEWAKNTFGKTIIFELFLTLVRTPGAERDQKKLSAAVETAAGLATMINNRLNEKTYLGGENLSFADIILGSLLYRYYTLDFERAQTPALDVYYERLKSRPHFVEHVMIDYSSMQVD